MEYRALAVRKAVRAMTTVSYKRGSQAVDDAMGPLRRVSMSASRDLIEKVNVDLHAWVDDHRTGCCHTLCKFYAWCMT